MSGILDAKMTNSRNIYFLHILYLIHAEYDFIFSDSSNKCYFHFRIYYLGESVSSEDVNPDFVCQSNEIDKTLSFGKCSDAKTSIKMSTTAVNLTSNI